MAELLNISPDDIQISSTEKSYKNYSRIPKRKRKKLWTIYKGNVFKLIEYIEPFVLLDLYPEKMEYKQKQIKGIVSRKDYFMEPKNSEVKKILVVGDWLVDEHWVTGIHRSPTSSRTGQAHYRVLQNTQSTIQSLCGAGQTASILYQAKCDSKDLCEVIGSGVWHQEDTNSLTAMLDPKTVEGWTHHRLIHSNIKKSIAATLIHLCELVGKAQSVNYGTTRIMRIYQHTGDKINLIQRIDWEMPIPNGKDRWITEEDKLARDKLKDLICSTKTHELDAVVIKDMCKGVVSSTLINWLAETRGTVNVFV